jgi:gamma-glutamyltranspeptidase
MTSQFYLAGAYQTQCPPNGQGLVALLALGILEAAQENGTVKPLMEMEHNSAEYLHTLIEALRYGPHIPLIQILTIAQTGIRG